MRSRLHEMCDVRVMTAPTIATTDQSADATTMTLSALWKTASPDKTLPSPRGGRQARAQLREPAAARRQSRPEVAGRAGGKLERGSLELLDDEPGSARSKPSLLTAPLGLYLHIPFCAAICNYCNFNRSLFDGALKTRYVEALIAEITRAGGAGRAGGTAGRSRGCRRRRGCGKRPTRSTSAAARRPCWNRRKSAASSTPVSKRSMSPRSGR